MGMGAAIVCPRCRVTVALDKIDVPNRCPHKDCPLNEKKPSDEQRSPDPDKV